MCLHVFRLLPGCELPTVRCLEADAALKLGKVSFILTLADGCALTTACRCASSGGERMDVAVQLILMALH